MHLPLSFNALSHESYEYEPDKTPSIENKWCQINIQTDRSTITKLIDINKRNFEYSLKINKHDNK